MSINTSPLASVYNKFALEINARLNFITNILRFSPELNILILDAKNNNRLWEELLIGLAPFETLFNVVVQWYEREINQVKNSAIYCRSSSSTTTTAAPEAAGTL